MNLPALPQRWPVLLLILLVLQAPLILNPGWFSHDELQWAARAAVPHFGELPWLGWTEFQQFQYRPLTFNLWLAISWLCFDTPWQMHALFVLLGSVNALLLAAVLRDAQLPARTASAAAIVFCLSPCVVYVHAWVGTLADLLVMLAGLSALRLTQACAQASPRRMLILAIALPALTTAALLCKESAIVLPAFLLLALHRHSHPRRALLLIAFAALPVLAYLALRLGILLDPPRTHTGYDWSLHNPPARLAEYLLFPFMPLFEPSATLGKPLPMLLFAAACLALVFGALARRGWRWPLVWLGMITALLAPVLLLATSYAQYAYLASAAAIGIAAAAWPGLSRKTRIVLGGVGVTVIAHGCLMMAVMVRVGMIERNFNADLHALLAGGAASLVIAPASDAKPWILRRLLHEVPQYRHARLAQAGEKPDFFMQGDGHLLASMP